MELSPQEGRTETRAASAQSSLKELSTARITAHGAAFRAGPADRRRGAVIPDALRGRLLLPGEVSNNPQHRRVLVNELLGIRYEAGVAVGDADGIGALIEVGEELIRLTPELCIELPRSRTPCTAGLQFNSP
jgi:hypothetical protein